MSEIFNSIEVSQEVKDVVDKEFEKTNNMKRYINGNIKLYIVKNCELLEFDNYLDLSYMFNIQISDKGKITFNNIEDTISYNMEEWTINEIRIDFAKTRLSKFVTIIKGEKL